MLARHFLATSKVTTTTDRARGLASNGELVDRLVAFNNASGFLILVVALLTLISVSQ